MTRLLLAAAPGELTIEVTPAETQVFIDGKKKGDGSKPIVVKLQPGEHVIRLTHKGDAHEEAVMVKSAEKKKWTWTFE
jgi:PEGA domain